MPQATPRRSGRSSSRGNNLHGGPTIHRRDAGTSRDGKVIAIACVVVLAILAAFAIGQASRGPSSAPQEAPKPTWKPAAASAPDGNDISHMLRSGQEAGSAAAADLADWVSTRVRGCVEGVQNAVEDVQNAVEGAIFKGQTLLSNTGAAVAGTAAGFVALIKNNPAGVGYSALHASVAAGWATQVPRPGLRMLTAAAPWASALFSLAVAFHTLHLLGSFASKKDEPSRPWPAPLPQPPQAPPPERTSNAAQVILALEAGIAIGAASALFGVWLTKQKWPLWGTTRSHLSQSTSRPTLEVTPERPKGEDGWPVFTGSKELEAGVSQTLFTNDDAENLVSGRKQFFRRDGDKATVVDSHFVRELSEACSARANAVADRG